MKRYYCWSGGKDSSASIIVGNEMGLDCDGVIMSEVMFSHKENISGENPKHIEWVYNEAIPIIEKMGYKVIIVKAKKDFLDYFHLVRGERSKYTGKLAGFPLVGRGKCEIKKPLKLRPMQEFFKGVGECEQIVGICADEKERLLSLAGGGKRSVLAENGIAEKSCFDICRSKNLLSPYYDGEERQGCWFCPNQRVCTLAKLAKEQPHLWQRMCALAETPNLVNYNFKPNVSFESIKRQVEMINNQINIFDYLKELGL